MQNISNNLNNLYISDTKLSNFDPSNPSYDITTYNLHLKFLKDISDTIFYGQNYIFPYEKIQKDTILIGISNHPNLSSNDKFKITNIVEDVWINNLHISFAEFAIKMGLPVETFGIDEEGNLKFSLLMRFNCVTQEDITYFDRNK